MAEKEDLRRVGVVMESGWKRGCGGVGGVVVESGWMRSGSGRGSWGGRGVWGQG